MSKATRMTLIITSGLVLLGLAGFSVLSGATLELADVVEALMAGIAGLLAGMGFAR